MTDTTELNRRVAAKQGYTIATGNFLGPYSNTQRKADPRIGPDIWFVKDGCKPLRNGHAWSDNAQVALDELWHLLNEDQRNHALTRFRIGAEYFSVAICKAYLGERE